MSTTPEATASLRRGRRAVRIETAFALLSAVLAIVTLVWPNWIEIVFRTDPDRGSGALEWLIAGALGVVALVLVLLAALQQSRLRAATGRS